MIWMTDDNSLKRLNAFERRQMLAHGNGSKNLGYQSLPSAAACRNDMVRRRASDCFTAAINKS